MELWHLTQDAPRVPARVAPDERTELLIGTWPIEPGQTVWLDYTRTKVDGSTTSAWIAARWLHNSRGNSYWSVTIGPFARGDRIDYRISGSSPAGSAATLAATFRVGSRLHLALMWHQHQPLYKDVSHDQQKGSYRRPWVRLHAIRDYYSMAALVAQHPELHLTINLTPILLWQLEDYTLFGATDRSLELTLTLAEDLTAAERQELIDTFFDADWHGQIFPHPRYRELFERRTAAEPFGTQELRDLQMWFNLAWFGEEFREGPVELVTGERVAVNRFVSKGREYTPADLSELIAEQFKVLRAVIPIHRQLQERGQIEVSTSPFYHPILPLLIDSDEATIDRPGARHPKRFSYPEDAREQVKSAVEFYRHRFGTRPRGMWPAEGAVSEAAVPMFAQAGLTWIASDAGVLTRSGRWGYDTDDPDVLCRPYRIEEVGSSISIFFRDTRLSDEVGFHYQGYSDDEAAARDFIRQVRERFAVRNEGPHERVLTVILDGENAWGAYRNDGRRFLHALYRMLEEAKDLITVTFSECLEGAAERDLEAHPPANLERLHELFTGSWIDENGSAPGVDLGTWVGEPEENRAWELLGQARHRVEQVGATQASHPSAFQALYTAEGSDWYWWLGEDQDSGRDDDFDELFRAHLANVYRGLGEKPPGSLARPIVPRTLVWTFGHTLSTLGRFDRLTVQTNCPGVLEWNLDDGQVAEEPLRPAGGVMAGVQRHQLTLGPFPTGNSLTFRFRCRHPDCDGRGPCCRFEWNRLGIESDSPSTTR